MTGGIRSLGRVEWQALALLLFAFAAGALSGVAIDRLLAPGRPPVPLGPPRRGQLPPQLDRLGLTPQQHDSVLAILEAYRPRTDSVLRELMPRLRALTVEAEEKIRAVLTDEQRRQYDRQRPPGARPALDPLGAPPPGGRTDAPPPFAPPGPGGAPPPN